MDLELFWLRLENVVLKAVAAKVRQISRAMQMGNVGVFLMQSVLLQLGIKISAPCILLLFAKNPTVVARAVALPDGSRANAHVHGMFQFSMQQRRFCRQIIAAKPWQVKVVRQQCQAGLSNLVSRALCRNVDFSGRDGFKPRN